MKLAPLLTICLVVACAPAVDSNAQSNRAQKTETTRRPPADNSSPAPPAGAPRLSLPIDCTIGETCALQNHVDRDPGSQATDYRCGHQTYQGHGGVDIRLLNMSAQRAGVDVLAAAAGTVSRLRDGVADVSVKVTGAASVAGAECGNGLVIDHGGGWETQYCHLARGSIKVRQGDKVIQGQPIAQVGLSGNTEYPHLHLTVRHGAETIDPFAPSSGPKACDQNAGAAAGLWDAPTAEALAYRRGAVLNSGFAGEPVAMDAAEAGSLATPARSTRLVAYVRTINLEAGDIQSLEIKRPDGSQLVESQLPPLDRAKAQYLMYAGKNPPVGGWAPGRYEATYRVRRGADVALEAVFSFTI